MKISLIILHLGFFIPRFGFTVPFTGFRALTDMRMSQGVAFTQKMTLMECCLICAKVENCTSVNYNNVTSVCEKNLFKMISRQYRIKQVSGWKVYEKLPCGLGYTSGEHCHHIQNTFQYDAVLTFQEASDFCYLLGEDLATLANEQEKADVESDSELADVFVNAYIWLNNTNGTSCMAYRREDGATVWRNCDLNAAVVCERRDIN